MINQVEPPNPGGEEAIAQGCTCPILDNAHGLGAWRQNGIFWINCDCPLHGDSQRKLESSEQGGSDRR